MGIHSAHERSDLFMIGLRGLEKFVCNLGKTGQLAINVRWVGGNIKSPK